MADEVDLEDLMAMLSPAEVQALVDEWARYWDVRAPAEGAAGRDAAHGDREHLDWLADPWPRPERPPVGEMRKVIGSFKAATGSSLDGFNCQQHLFVSEARRSRVLGCHSGR